MQNYSIMDNKHFLISIWIVGWIIWSIAYIISSFRKAKSSNENWSFPNSIAFTLILLIIWPFALVVYVWFNIRLRMKDSIELPEELKVVELSKESSKIEKVMDNKK